MICIEIAQKCTAVVKRTYLYWNHGVEIIWEQNSENTLYFAVRVAINYVPAEAMELRGLGGGAGDEGNDDASIPGWFRASLASFEYTEFLSELLFSSWKEKKGLWIKATAFSNTKKTNKLWEKKNQWFLKEESMFPA